MNQNSPLGAKTNIARLTSPKSDLVSKKPVPKHILGNQGASNIRNSSINSKIICVDEKMNSKFDFKEPKRISEEKLVDLKQSDCVDPQNTQLIPSQTTGPIDQKNEDSLKSFEPRTNQFTDLEQNSQPAGIEESNQKTIDLNMVSNLDLSNDQIEKSINSGQNDSVDTKEQDRNNLNLSNSQINRQNIFVQPSEKKSLKMKSESNIKRKGKNYFFYNSIQKQLNSNHLL